MSKEPISGSDFFKESPVHSGVEFRPPRGIKSIRSVQFLLIDQIPVMRVHLVEDRTFDFQLPDPLKTTSDQFLKRLSEIRGELKRFSSTLHSQARKNRPSFFAWVFSAILPTAEAAADELTYFDLTHTFLGWVLIFGIIGIVVSLVIIWDEKNKGSDTFDNVLEKMLINSVLVSVLSWFGRALLEDTSVVLEKHFGLCEHELATPVESEEGLQGK